MMKPIENADFGKTTEDYLTHRAGFPESFFERLTEWMPVGGKQVLDLGTGTGTLARGLAARGHQLTAIDLSQEMITAAKALDKEGKISFHVSSAESVPLSNHSQDVVIAGQCWHWFKRAETAKECRRLLRPGGLLIIAHYDWLPILENVVTQTERLIESYNPAWKAGGGTGIHPTWFRDLAEEGFSDIRSFSYDEPATYSHEAWRGRIRASAGIAASLPAEQVTQFDAALAEMLVAQFPDQPLSIAHRVFAVCGTTW